jgi:presenilin-like A22 family membrane protease
MDTKNIIPLLAMPALLIAVELGALLLSLPVQASGVVAFQDPTSMENPIYFIAILLVFTAFLLVLIRYDIKWAITWIIRISIFLTFVYIFMAIVFATLGQTAAATPDWWNAVIPVTAVSSLTDEMSVIATVIALALSVVATIILYKYPEWYVIDALGILIGAGVAAIFGASLDVWPVGILLALLAIYDAISVYKTKHMITLAEGIIDQKTPILFVIPKRRNYSFINEGIGKISDGGERAAFIIGMGDMIMPAILVVSANVFLKGWRLAGMINLPALGAIIGSLAGMAVLLHFVMSGKPQAGLPPLCGGTILGFLVGWALMMWVG